MADLGTATIRCTLGAGYIDTSEAERLEGEIAGKDAEIAALEAKIVELNGNIETARADALAAFASVIDRSAVNPELPGDLTEIGMYAFYNCNELVLAAGLPIGLTKVGTCAFEGCAKLALTELPEGVTDISYSAFSSCSSIKLTRLPTQLESLGVRAFSGCYGIKQMTIPPNVKKISDYAFYSGGLTTCTFQGTPQSISTKTFLSNNNLTTINVPWAEGEVSGAPWGATNATINYNYTGGDT